MLLRIQAAAKQPAKIVSIPTPAKQSNPKIWKFLGFPPSPPVSVSVPLRIFMKKWLEPILKKLNWKKRKSVKAKK
jgi:hypothetical protein